MSASVAVSNDGALPPPPIESHADRLASHGEIVASWLARPNRLPSRWRSSRFARTVDLVRTHLQPLTNRDLLVRSYAREHFQFGAVARPEPRLIVARDATEVAYALRWLELAESRSLDSWPGLVGRQQPE